MDPEYARRYRELYHTHWWWRAREHVVLETLRRNQRAAGWRRILDVGCGDGLLFDRLGELGEVEGVEADPSLVSPGGRYRAQIHVQPFDATFQPPTRYSLILMLDVIEHLRDPVGALRHAGRLLERDGIVVATVPAFPILWTTHDDLNHHVTRYTRRSFGALAPPAGLRVDAARYFFHWLFPAKLALRVLEALTRSQPTPPRVPAPWVNRSLYLLSRLEQRLLTPLPVPFGASLLVVARSSTSETAAS